MKLVGGNQEFDGFESGEANKFDLGIDRNWPGSNNQLPF